MNMRAAKATLIATVIVIGTLVGALGAGALVLSLPAEIFRWLMVAAIGSTVAGTIALIAVIMYRDMSKS